MPSQNKTPNYNLNQWEGTEYPMRQDFVDDNAKTDAALKGLADGQAPQALLEKLNGSELDADKVDGRHAQSSLTDRSDALMRVGAFGWGSGGLPDITESPDGILYTSLFRATTAQAILYSLPTDNGGILFTRAYNSVGNLYAAQEYTLVNQVIARTFYRTLNLGVWTPWREVSWADPPVETVITSGFASGWSGEIRCSRAQNGIVHLGMSLFKNIDFSASTESVFTLPVDFRPNTYQRTTTSIFSSGGSPLNAFTIIGIDTYGNISILPVSGTALTNTRSVRSISFTFISGQ